MGYELRLRAQGGPWPPPVVAPEMFLQRLPQRASLSSLALTWTSPVQGTLEVRRGGEAATMPAVTVVLEERGFYLLDNDAALASLVMGELVRYLLGACESVTITEP